MWTELINVALSHTQGDEETLNHKVHQVDTSRRESGEQAQGAHNDKEGLGRPGEHGSLV